jgi:hypothetical protein
VRSIPSCLQEWIDVVRYSGLIDLVCALGLPVLISYAFGPPPRSRVPCDARPPTPARSGSRRAGQSSLISPPIGLADIVPSSPLPAAAGVARPPTPAGSGSRRAGQSSRISPPIGLADIDPNSPLPAAAGVGRPPTPDAPVSPPLGLADIVPN